MASRLWLKIDYLNHANRHTVQVTVLRQHSLEFTMPLLMLLTNRRVSLWCCLTSQHHLILLTMIFLYIYIDFLRDHIGLDGSVLDLFRSYFSGRTQCVSIAGVLSELSELMFGVTQDSALRPVEFSIYTIPLGAIMRHYKIKYHIYADDTQLY